MTIAELVEQLSWYPSHYEVRMNSNDLAYDALVITLDFDSRTETVFLNTD
jgi:hypothetical protein